MPTLLFLTSEENFSLDYYFFFFNLNWDKKYSGINVNLEKFCGWSIMLHFLQNF